VLSPSAHAQSKMQNETSQERCSDYIQRYNHRTSTPGIKHVGGKDDAAVIGQKRRGKVGAIQRANLSERNRKREKRWSQIMQAARLQDTQRPVDEIKSSSVITTTKGEKLTLSFTTNKQRRPLTMRALSGSLISIT
jgi:hypothetical protein